VHHPSGDSRRETHCAHVGRYTPLMCAVPAKLRIMCVHHPSSDSRRETPCAHCDRYTPLMCVVPATFFVCLFVRLFFEVILACITLLVTAAVEHIYLAHRDRYTLLICAVPAHINNYESRVSPCWWQPPWDTFRSQRLLPTNWCTDKSLFFSSFHVKSRASLGWWQPPRDTLCSGRPLHTFVYHAGNK